MTTMVCFFVTKFNKQNILINFHFKDDTVKKPKQIPYQQSKWYNLSVNCKMKKPVYLPGFYIPWLYESLDGIDNNCPNNDNNDNQPNGTNMSRIDGINRLTQRTKRHQAFHYHRIRQHLRTSYSLFTHL